MFALVLEHMTGKIVNESQKESSPGSGTDGY
jgi:hypothetical protein